MQFVGVDEKTASKDVAEKTKPVYAFARKKSVG